MVYLTNVLPCRLMLGVSMTILGVFVVCLLLVRLTFGLISDYPRHLFKVVSHRQVTEAQENWSTMEVSQLRYSVNAMYGRVWFAIDIHDQMLFFNET